MLQPHDFTNEHGFTILEIMFVTVFFLLLLAFGVFNAFQSQRKTSLRTSIDQLVSDLREQQIKAMVGDTEGRGINDSYGVFFSNNTYVLFHGTTYVSNNPSNFTVTLDPSLQFLNNTFPFSVAVFSKGSGEVNGGGNSVQLKNTQNNSVQTIQINRYGVILQAN